MKEWIGNIIIRFVLNSNSKFKTMFYEELFNHKIKYERSLFVEKYKIAPTFRFNGIFVNFYGDGEIVCGENSYIGSYSTVQADKNYKVIIGNNCAISHNVRIYTSSYCTDQDFNNNINQVKGGNVIIGNGVWIGANVFINPGVIIGDNSVIGANSVVTKDIAKDTVNGGVPCKFIREKAL